MIDGRPEPAEKVFDEKRHAVRRRRDVHRARSREHADVPAAERARVVRQRLHHHAVRLEQSVRGKRIERREKLVGADRVSDFEDLPRRRDDAPAFENGADLAFRERVALDRERGADRADAVRLAQTQRLRPVGALGAAPEPTGDFGDQIDRFRGNGERRSGHESILSDPARERKSLFPAAFPRAEFLLFARGKRD